MARRGKGADAFARLHGCTAPPPWCALLPAQALAARGVSPPNEYLGFALTAYCRASGVGSFYASKASDTAVEIELTVTMP